LNETELKSKITENGSNYEKLLKHHDEHYRSLDRILNTLNSNNIQTRVMQRDEYAQTEIDWADAVLTAGGDGTFLLAATKIVDSSKPVIGVNTDTCKRSFGFEELVFFGDTSQFSSLFSQLGRPFATAKRTIE
jgi:NAD+ kinase